MSKNLFEAILDLKVNDLVITSDNT